MSGGSPGSVVPEGSAPLAPIIPRQLRLRPWWGQKTKKPLAGARGLRAGLGHGVRCRGGLPAAGGHCGPARLLPIIMAYEGTRVSLAHSLHSVSVPSHDTDVSLATWVRFTPFRRAP